MKPVRIAIIAIIAGFAFLFNQPAKSDNNECTRVIKHCKAKLDRLRSTLKQVSELCGSSSGAGCANFTEHLKQLIEKTSQECEEDIKEACS